MEGVSLASPRHSVSTEISGAARGGVRREESVVSPTYGTIVGIGNNTDLIANNRDSRVTIYIAKEDDHLVFAPVSGKIHHVFTVNGKFSPETNLFVANPNLPYEMHTGRIYLEWADRRITMALEVGKPKYVTDRVKMSVNFGYEVESGRKIGEILIGSTSYVYYNSYDYRIPESVSLGTVVVGGMTAILEKK